MRNFLRLQVVLLGLLLDAWDPYSGGQSYGGYGGDLPQSPVATPVEPLPQTPVAQPVSPPYQPSLAPQGGGYGGAPSGGGGSYMGAPVSGGGGYSTAGAAGPAGTTTNISDTPYAWMMNIPDVAGVLNEWQQGGHTDDWLKGHIMQTGWYQTTSQSNRTWEQLIAQDPATAQQNQVGKAGDIMLRSKQLGLDVPWDFALSMAVDAIRFNWNDNQLNDALGHVGWQPDGTGVLQQTKQKLQELSNQYLVPVSDQALTFATDAAVFQQQGTAGWESYLKDQAKTLFPSMSKAIDAGTTPQQFVDPYRQVAAKELEINPNTIDFMQPKWSKAINNLDPKTGQRTALGLADWQTTLRTDPVYGYDHTQGAKTAAAGLATQLLQKFGQVA